MKTISKKILKNVRYLCGTPDLAKSRFDQLKRTFSDNDAYLLFAEPVYMPETQTIIWTTPLNGNFVPFHKLSPDDQALAKNILRKKINTLLTLSGTYNDPNLKDFLFKCLEVPSMQSIFLANDKGQSNVVLTDWGFVSDEPGSERGLLAKIIEVKKTDVKIKTVFHDDKSPAPEQKITFVSEAGEKVLLTDNQGVAIMKNIPVDTKFKVITDWDGEKKEYEFFCYENGNYTVEVLRKLNLKFKVVDQNNNPVPNQKIIFETEGKQTEKISDNQGVIVLENIKTAEKITAYQTDENGQKINIHNFIAEKDKEYVIKLKKKTYVMRIKVVDKDGNPVKNAEVLAKFSGKTETFRSDENGYIYITDIKPGTEVKIKAKAKKQKK